MDNVVNKTIEASQSGGIGVGGLVAVGLFLGVSGYLIYKSKNKEKNPDNNSFETTKYENEELNKIKQKLYQDTKNIKTELVRYYITLKIGTIDIDSEKKEKLLEKYPYLYNKPIMDFFSYGDASLLNKVLQEIVGDVNDKTGAYSEKIEQEAKKEAENILKNI